jgi:uncharacterized membrane protein HdeD (DUF308 family)
MVDSIQPDLTPLRGKIAATMRAHWGLFVAEGVLMMVLGALAIALPNISTVAIEVLIGWLFLVGGALRTAVVWRRRQLPGFGWSFSTAMIASLLGVILVVGPIQGVLTLAMLLIVFFIMEGVAAIVVAVRSRPHGRHWVWSLLSGVVDLALAYLIWRGWPTAATWAIGLLVGINMLFLGWALVMTAVAARTMSSP